MTLVAAHPMPPLDLYAVLSNYICANLEPAGQCVEPLPTFPSGALIGVVIPHVIAYTPGVSPNGIFGIGSRATVTAPISGDLWLRINDADGGLSDNDGILTVRVITQ
jgi:hypothetical protein